MCLSHFSTCFEEPSAHQENQLYQYIIWYVSLRVCGRLGMQVKEFLSDLHTRQPHTQSDIYQMMYWYNWFSWWWALGCSKHVKSKGLPQQTEVAQWVPGRLRPRIFLTFQHYKGGRSSAKCTGCLYPRRNPWYSLSEAESTSGHMVLSGEPQKKSPVIPPGIDPRTVRPVAQCLNHCATPGRTRNM